MQLLYFADPMCSWCYGFGPELAKLSTRHPEARVELVMGGLRPFNREPMSAAFRDMLRTHWRHVREASGLAFDEALLAREGFVYDTEPACRAVVTARTIDASRAMAYFHAVQAAFYARGRDVTQPAVLGAIASECGYDGEALRRMMETDGLRDETRLDFSTTQSLGVTGFPTLALANGKELFLLSSGLTAADVLEERLAEIGRRTGAGS